MGTEKQPWRAAETEYEVHGRLSEEEGWKGLGLGYDVDTHDLKAVIARAEALIPAADRSRYPQAEYRIVEIVRTVVWTHGAKAARKARMKS